MDERVKTLWVEALESGEFHQGQERLRRGYVYCCLGVLCELHRMEVNGEGWERESHYLGSGGTLPEKVMAWAGLSKPSPVLGLETASQHNDSGKTFPEIAALIREHL